MARKQLDRLLSEAVAMAARLSANDDALSSREVRELLAEAGHHSDDLRRRLHEELKTIAINVRHSGRLVPRHLLAVIDATAGLEVLAEKNPKAALARLRQSFRELSSGALRRAFADSQSIAVARAYRKTAELSSDDAALLDEIEHELKSRMTDAGKDSNGGQRTE